MFLNSNISGYQPLRGVVITPLFLSQRMENSMRYEMGEANNHARWCFSRLRFISCLLKDSLRREGIWDDLTQQLYATAYQAWQQEMTIGETRRYASRQIHAFLKSYGYKAYRNSYIKLENAFSGVFQDWQVDNLASPEEPSQRCVRHYPLEDHHLKEQIVNTLKRKPEGMTRSGLSMYLEAPVKELQWYLDSLVKNGRVIEVKREAWEGHITPLFLIAGAEIPEQKRVKTETYERIRHAYFVEGKSANRIAMEYHHNWNTVRKAISSSLAPPVPTNVSTGLLLGQGQEKELAPV